MPPLTIHIELYAPGLLDRIAPLTPEGALEKDFELWKAQIGRVFKLIKALNGKKGIHFVFPDLELASEYKNSSAKAPAPEYNYKLGILFLRTYHLSSSSDFFWHLPNSKLRPISPGQNQEIDLPYFPILSIGTEDIAPLFAEEQPEEIAYHHPYLSQEIDARVKFLDSNIWHRYVALKQCPLDIEDFEGRLSATLKDIISYFKAGLYDTVAAKTSLEFQLRMLRESFIARLGDKGHNKVVTPFKFHSETRMKLKAENEKAFFDQKWNGTPLKDQLKWRLLMVDDYAADPISAAEPQQQDGPLRKGIISKMDWIRIQMSKLKDLLDIDYPKPAEKESGYITSPRRSADKGIIPKSLEMMRETAYDIILLDYLLGTKNGETSRDASQREYGYEFLLKLLEDSNIEKFNFNRGPIGLFWIFPISSFPFALSDKLRQIGINNFTELWHLSRGGDPISNPYLFQYNLLDFMRQQVIECLMGDVTLRTYLEPVFNITILERWAEVMNKKLQGLELKLLIIDNESDNSYFAESLHPIASSKYYRGLIRELKELMEILQTGVRKYAYYVEYKKRWEQFKADYPDYPQTIGLIKEKLKDTVYEKVITTAEMVKQNKNKKRLDLIDKGLFLLPKEIGQVKNLEELYLNSNRLQSLPSWINQLTQLKKIHLRANQFIEFPMELEGLKHLSYIDLEENEMPEMYRKLARSRPEVLEMIKEAKSISLDFQIQKKIIENLLKNKRQLDAVTQLHRITNRFKPDNEEWIQGETKNILQKIHRIKSRDYRSNIINDSYYDAELKKIEYEIRYLLGFFKSDSAQV